MTDDKRVKPPEQTGGDDGAPTDEGDPTLGALVRLANTGGFTLGVTVWVGGSVISGTLVGVARYFEGVAGLFENASGEGGGSLATMYRGFAKTFSEEIGASPEEAIDAPYALTYIHLEEARVFTPSGGMPVEGFWWRGQIDRVDGFSFGTLSFSK